MIRIAASMIGQLYRHVCARCLAEEIGTTVRDADEVARVLAGSVFVRQWERCGRCRESDIVLTHVPRYPLLAHAE
jgi:hypothetical protein